jgi:hypothetical protein
MSDSAFLVSRLDSNQSPLISNHNDLPSHKLGDLNRFTARRESLSN